MTIRLTQRSPHIHPNSGEISLGTLGPVVARADTREEAEQARRAFENVLAPRFTRDEAIRRVRYWPGVDAVVMSPESNVRREFIAGMRAALEALAAAGVFVDSDAFAEKYRTPTMADLLDAAGIR